MRKRRYVCLVIASLAFISVVWSNVHSESFKYESRGRRDPFVPLVGMDIPKASKLEDITSINDIKLEGVASGKAGKMVAILNGEIVKEGDRFGELKIKKITKKAVTIMIGDKSYAVDIVEGGVESGR